MTCAHCDELKARVEWLEGELGLREEIGAIETLRQAFRIAPAAARVALILYRAGGKTVPNAQLCDALPEHDHAIERDDSRILLVYAHRLRTVLGKDSLETAWGHGYRLTPAGIGRIAEALGQVA